MIGLFGKRHTHIERIAGALPAINNLRQVGKIQAAGKHFGTCLVPSTRQRIRSTGTWRYGIQSAANIEVEVPGTADLAIDVEVAHGPAQLRQTTAAFRITALNINSGARPVQGIAHKIAIHGKIARLGGIHQVVDPLMTRA